MLLRQKNQDVFSDITKVDVKSICDLEKFDLLKFEDDARFGIVAYGIYECKKAVLKVLPHNLKSRCEILYIMKKKYNEMVDVFRCSNEKYYYIMECGEKLPIITDSIEKFRYIKDLFIDINKQSIRCNEELVNYEDKLLNRYKKLADYKEISDYLCDAYNKYCLLLENNMVYSLHGDIRYSNIIQIDNKFRIIDPLGYNGIKELEFVRYIEDDLFVFDNSVEFYSMLEKLLFSFSSIGIDDNLLCDLLYIDSVLRTSSSVLLKEKENIINRGLSNAKWLADFIS